MVIPMPEDDQTTLNRFAAAALTGLLATKTDRWHDHDATCERAWKLADRMMATRRAALDQPTVKPAPRAASDASAAKPAPTRLEPDGAGVDGFSARRRRAEREQSIEESLQQLERIAGVNDQSAAKPAPGGWFPRAAPGGVWMTEEELADARRRIKDFTEDPTEGTVPRADEDDRR